MGRTEIIEEASKARAIVALLVPLLFPFILAAALSRSGHGLMDYAALIASGKLSWIRQGVMWIALGVFVYWYFIPAINALKYKQYISVNGENLIVPGGGIFEIASIKEISVKKEFVHKILTLNIVSNGVHRVVVTFAKDNAADIRRKLASNSRLQNLLVSR